MKQALLLTRYDNQSGDCRRLFDENDFSIASLRLQVKPLVEALKRFDYNYNILSLNTNTPETLDLISYPDIAIFTKANTTADMQYNLALSNLAALARLKCRKIPIVCIYSDNLASEEKHPTGEFHRNLLSLSNFIICPSKRLEKESRKHASDQTPTFVVNDPWQVRQELPFQKLNRKSIVKLLWFGQGANLKYLIRILPNLMQNLGSERKYEITILSEFRALEKFKHYWDKLAPPNHSRQRTVLWNQLDQPVQLERELFNAHITLLPSDPLDCRKCGVSHNRVVDSVRGGCIPIASPMDSYREIQQSCILTSNFSHTIKLVIDKYNIIAAHLNNSRSKILEEFSPEVNKKRWEFILREITTT